MSLRAPDDEHGVELLAFAHLTMVGIVSWDLSAFGRESPGIESCPLAVEVTGSYELQAGRAQRRIDALGSVTTAADEPYAQG